MFRFLRRENLVKQSQQSISCPAINTPEKDGAKHSDSSSDSDGEIAEVSRKQRMFARRSIRRDRKKQKEQQKKLENNMISMDDFLSKQAEFKIWLKEEKQKCAADLKSPKLKAYFKDFMKMWNKKKLPQKYYRGSSSSDTPPPSRSQRFNFVEGSPFPDLSGFPQPIDLSLEGVLLDSPFSTFGKAPGDPMTPNSTPRILKLPDIEPDHADKENSSELPNLSKKKAKEPSSAKKKTKNKNSTPKKSKMKNDNPYKVTVLSWTSKGELSVHPASPSSFGNPSSRASSVGQLNTSVPYQEVKDAAVPLEISDYDPLYADPDPLFCANTSVSRSKSLDTGLSLDSPRTAVGEGCKSVEELYAVPVKKKRMSIEKKDTTITKEVITSPPPPLPPKRKSPLEAWPYQSVVFDGNGAGPVCSTRKDTEDDEFPSPPPPGQGFKVFRESVLSPCPTESPMRMAVSMPDLSESQVNESEEESSSSSSSSSDSSSSENEAEKETFEVKVKVLDPEIQQFLDGDPSLPPPPPKSERMSDFCPQIRLSLLPPPPPELLMDTPPDEEDGCRMHSEAYSSRSSMITEQGTPRSSRMLDDDILPSQFGKSSKYSTPKSVLNDSSNVVETPPPVLVPIQQPIISKSLETVPEAKVVPPQVVQLKEAAHKSRRVSEGPVIVPPPSQTSKKAEVSSCSSGSETCSESLNVGKGETPNHDYLDDALTDLDTSAEKDEVFSYKQALSGAMSSLKTAYASSVEDLTADFPKRRQQVINGTKDITHLCAEDVLNQRSTPKHNTRNRHHSENSAFKLQKCAMKMAVSSEEEPNPKMCKLTPIVESTKEPETLSQKRKPPVVKPKPSKSKVTEAVEKARQRQSSSDRSSVSSTSSHTSVSSTSSNGSSVHSCRSSDKDHSLGSGSHELRSATPVDNRSLQSTTQTASRILGQLNQNVKSRPATPPRKPPRTPSSASKGNTVDKQACRTPPSTPTRQNVKGILKLTPTKNSSQGSPNRQRKPLCSKSVLPPSHQHTHGLFETDIDSVLEDNSENTDPNCDSRGVRETDLDKILAEMQSSYLLSPLTSVETTSDVNF